MSFTNRGISKKQQVAFIFIVMGGIQEVSRSFTNSDNTTLYKDWFEIVTDVKLHSLN